MALTPSQKREAMIRAYEEAQQKKALVNAGKSLVKPLVKKGVTSAGKAILGENKWLSDFGSSIKALFNTPADQIFSGASEAADLAGMGLSGVGGEAGGAAGAAGSASATVGQAVPLAGWIAGMLAKGPSEAGVKGDAMRGVAAAAATIPVYGWAVAAALTIASFAMPEDEYVPPELYLRGGEDLVYGEEGLGGFEGILAPGNHLFHEYAKGDPWLREQQTQPTYRPDIKGDQFYDVWDDYAKFKENPDYYRQQKGWTKTPSGWIDQDAVYVQDEALGFDWGFEGPEQLRFGKGIDPERWVNTEPASNMPGERVPDLTDPIVSAKYGDIKAYPDLWDQNAMDFYLYGGSGADTLPIEGQYGAFKNTINQIAQGGIDLFNTNIKTYLGTLSESDRATMNEKLANTKFRVDFDKEAV